MYEEQRQEIDKAVVGLGEYQLCQPYKSYGIASKEWFNKNQKQRERILQKFANAKLIAVDQAEQDDVSLEVPSDVIDQDGPSTSNPLACTKLPTSIQYSMWAKILVYQVTWNF